MVLPWVVRTLRRAKRPEGIGTSFLVGVGLALAQFVPAFLTLDLFFRWGDMEPRGLRRRIQRWAALFAGLAGLFGALGGYAQWRLVGAPGLVMAPANLLPWWLLWRFGLRKQLTFLFKHDGGQDAANPDP